MKNNQHYKTKQKIQNINNDKKILNDNLNDKIYELIKNNKYEQIIIISENNKNK